MDSKEIATDFEKKVRDNLLKYLKSENLLGEIFPECIDVEECWPEIARDYLPDGAREFQQYPVSSLGWMMLIGMALAYYWDEDWVKYTEQRDFYKNIRDKRGYDELDDTVIQDILKYEGEAANMLSATVSACASRVFSLIQHEQVEPGTEAALGCYIGALHQLYLMGMAVELHTLGYKMTKMG